MRRQLAIVGGVTLLAGLAFTPPAISDSAGQASGPRISVSQTGDIHLGDPAYRVKNANPILIPASGSSGIASSYPAQITVPHAATITDVDVVLDGFSHIHPADVDVLLVGPGGQQALIMSDAGGGDDVTGLYLTLDDEADAPIPGSGLESTSYRPTNEGDLDKFAAPAPSPSTANTSLSVFDGTSAAGSWSLFVVDDSGADTGAFSGGWALELSLATAPYPSALNVNGVGSVTDLDVSVDNMTFTYADDIDLLLVGPQGQQATLMSDVGGDAELEDVDLTFDDEAAASLPDETALTAGTFRPTNVDETADQYPAPAPALSGQTVLSAFDGTDPNGQWRLFATDTVGGDVTSIDGWSLDIEFSDTTGPAGSISIAGEAATIRTTGVTLNLSATDPAPGSGVTEMRFSNDGQSFSAYRAYAPAAPWTLSPADGKKTIFAQFRDAAGNESMVVSDTIVVDSTGPSATRYKPTKNGARVSRKTVVTVVASEALAPSSVSNRSVRLTKGGEKKKVRAAVSYDPTKTRITLKTKKPLAKGLYEMTITTKVTDVIGNSFDQRSKPGAQRLTWTFKVS